MQTRSAQAYLDYQAMIGHNDPPEPIDDNVTPPLPRYAPLDWWYSYSGMRRQSTYEALARGDILAVKLGAKTLIDVPSGLAFMASLPVATFTTGLQRRAAREAAAAAQQPRRRGRPRRVPLEHAQAGD